MTPAARSVNDTVPVFPTLGLQHSMQRLLPPTARLRLKRSYLRNISAPNFNDLEGAASDVIEILKGIPEFAHAKIAVIGGLALWKYIKDYRTTEDVDFFITVKNAPPAVKNRLLKLPNSPFVEQAQYFYYKAQSGKLLQIDMVPDYQTPYHPSSAKVISTVSKGDIPYITPADLITFKIFSCGLRSDQAKKRRDATDVLALVTEVAVLGKVELDSMQRDKVLEGIDDVIAITGRKIDWWKQHLAI